MGIENQQGLLGGIRDEDRARLCAAHMHRPNEPTGFSSTAADRRQPHALPVDPMHDAADRVRHEQRVVRCQSQTRRRPERNAALGGMPGAQPFISGEVVAVNPSVRAIANIEYSVAFEHGGRPEVNLGVIPGFGGTQRLARLIGKGRAMELVLTGDLIDAAEAYRIGLANKVVAQEDLLDTARALAARIISKGQYAVRLAKEAIHNGLEMDLDRANRYESELFGLCFASHDQKEGMQAFLEKRPAAFTGN